MNGDDIIKDDWRELGFYYEFDSRTSVNQWRFYGSAKGIMAFVKILEDYGSDNRNDVISEHEHYWPYGNLKIMTLDKPVITSQHIAGSLNDLKHLAEIIKNKLDALKPGDTFSIDKEYGIDNTVTTKFFIMSDNFDPPSMDELIMSNRQGIVNKALGKE